MAYRVIKHFVDLQDNNYSYDVGDVFPHTGMVVESSRLAELSGSYNKQRQPLIAYEDDPEEISEMTKKELIEYAEKNGIDLKDAKTKAHILEIIENA